MISNNLLSYIRFPHRSNPPLPPEEEEPELAEICDDATPIGGTRAVEVPKFANQQKKSRQPAIPKVGMFYIGGKEAATAATEEEEDDESRESSPVLMSTSSSSADSGHGCSLKSSSAHTSASVSPIPPSYAARNRRGSLSASGGSAASSPTLALKSHQVKQQQQQQRRHNRPCSGVFSSRAQHNDNEVVGPFGGKPPLPMSSSFHGAMAGSTTQLEKMKSFNRTLRRARSFRGGRERSCSNASEYRRSNNNNNCSSNNKEKNDNTKRGSKRSVTYCVQRTKYGRKGWKVMLPPEAEEGLDDDNKAFFDKAALEKVMGRIRDLEFSGKEVPERITVEVN